MKQLQTAISQISRYKPTIDTTIVNFEEAFEQFGEKKSNKQQKGKITRGHSVCRIPLKSKIL